MCNCFQKAGRVLILAAFCAALFVPRLARAQKVDVNTNGMSDVWEALFGAEALSPTADTDGDGVVNLLESIAGTNPFDSNSVPRIAVFGVSSTNLLVGMPSALGKQYTLQSVLGLDSGNVTNWITEATLIARTGSVATFSVPIADAAKFFRMQITDVDTDGDGVNDWEEYVLGLDPTKAASNGQVDAFGQPLGDLAYVQGKLASQNVVTIIASDPTATQPDFGGSPLNLGVFTVARGGFPLTDISVNLDLGAPGPGVATEGLDFATLPRALTLPASVSSANIPVTPLANTNLFAPAGATLKVLPGAGYSVGNPSNATMLLYPSPTAKGTGLTGLYYTNASATYSNAANFNPANFKFSRTDTNVDFTWGNTSNPFPNNGYYCVRWLGQIQPQYSETYYIVANTDEGVKLWINDQLIINSWIAKSASDLTAGIALQGGVRYNIKMEYFQLTGSAVAHLSWYSASQSKQVIPTSRLYPTNATAAATAITSPLAAVGFVNQPFSFTNTAANTPLGFNASVLPPGLVFNGTNGVISGVPTLAGDFQVLITVSNAIGASSSVLDLQILDTGNAVVREVWTGVPGVNVSDIPVSIPATFTNTLNTLEGIVNFGDDYGERIRGYFTAPATANYYFWLAGSDAAEFWMSNDGEPANKVLRSYVRSGTASQQWNVLPKQRSSWLALVAGQRYYIEILHKAGTGTNDNWAVGWRQDPVGTNTIPTSVVPGYVLGRYYPLPASYVPGTLYAANMLAQGGVASSGVGSATLRLSADETQAILIFNRSGLSSPETAEHIHNDAYLNVPSGIMFDIDTTGPQPDGSYLWNIVQVGGLYPSNIVDIIKTGKSYINVHTINYPNGEINGHFNLANGSQTFSPPPPQPAWADDHSTTNGAARFLIQTTFGPSPAEIANVQALGYDGWLSNQFSLPATHYLPAILAKVNTDPTTPYPGNTVFNTWWQQSVTAPDQLRQRVAFALSEILVVSQNVLSDNGRALGDYYDILLDNAFGNFRQLLKDVTLSPAMGLYLDMRANDKGSITNGLHANENYAREIMQLFSIGLNRMWPDGTLVMDSAGNLVPTYDQNVINGFAATFTGWNYWQSNQANGRLPTSFSPAANYTNPMVLVPGHHDLGTKRLLDNAVLPAAQGTQADSSNTNFDAYCSQDLELALDSIFYNQNVGPLICRELIQRLVTSSPSGDYLYRVVQKFNDNGAGVRGDLQAVINAIFLDYEARSSAEFNVTTFGKQREPLLRVTAAARAFPPPTGVSGGYSQNGLATITVTTPVAHRLNNSDTVWLSFTDGSGAQPPPAQSYAPTITSPTTFNITAPGMSTGSYTQAVNVSISNMLTSTIDTTNVIFVNISGHGLSVGNPVYLAFTTGGAANGLYRIMFSTNGNTFAVETADPSPHGGNSLIPKYNGGGFTLTLKTNLLVSTALPHGLNPSDSVFINFTAVGSPADGQYQVVTVPDATHFTVFVATTNNQTQNGMTVYPLTAPPLVRSGSALLQWSTWAMNGTDGSLLQTALNSPTVFNFFFPDYKFPGPLASAGLTTPEFQLTSDTGVALQMNFVEAALLGNTGNTNGFSSFSGGNGSVVLDLGSWMTPALTSNAGIPSLVDSLNSLLCGGQLSSGSRAYIISYVANTSNFPYTTPTFTQMRDRVRAVVHLITASPDFIIQK